MSDTEVVAHIFSGIKMYLDPRDISLTPHVSLDHIWEETITRAWLQVIEPGDTVLDLGANFGYFGALAAQYGGTDARIVFFEANPNLIPYIEKTLSVNWLKQQSVVENLAVSDEVGTATLNILKDYIGSSSLHSPREIEAYMQDKMQVETEETVSVPTVTIDAYCRDRQIREVDLIKMDIEGYEEKAYAGMREVISASPNVTLFVEFTKGGYEDPRRFYKTMLDDFGHVYVIDEEGKLVEPVRTDYESVIGDSDDWVMPVFSKDGNLTARVAQRL
jgi:FkbM family methyltransferase